MQCSRYWFYGSWCCPVCYMCCARKYDEDDKGDACGGKFSTRADPPLNQRSRKIEMFFFKFYKWFFYAVENPLKAYKLTWFKLCLVWGPKVFFMPQLKFSAMKTCWINFEAADGEYEDADKKKKEGDTAKVAPESQDMERGDDKKKASGPKSGTEWATAP